MKQTKRFLFTVLSLILVITSLAYIMPIYANDECYAYFSLDTNYLLIDKTYTANFTKYPEDLEVT